MGWVGSPGKVRKCENHDSGKPAPPLTPAVAPVYVLDWAQRLCVSVPKGPERPPSQLHFTGEEGGPMNGRGDFLKGTQQSKGIYSSNRLFCASSCRESGLTSWPPDQPQAAA